MVPASQQILCSEATTPASPELVSGKNRKTDVLIIGAGPAGLSLASELSGRAVRFLILEKGGAVADSWRRMPRAMKMASPWKTNFLPGTNRHRHPANYEMSRAEYCDYLVDYAASLPVQTNTGVREVTKRADGPFLVQTSRGDYSARAVVNATGCFSNPFVPAFPGAAESTIPQLHTADYSDAETVRRVLTNNRAVILIVGKRLSAGQLLIELAEAGFTIALSHRSPIRYGAGPLGASLLFRIFPWMEWLKLRINGEQAQSNDVRMPGGTARSMIESGAVQTFPEILRFEHDSVVFTDGRRLRPNLVLYATGFRPAISHLAGSSLDLAHSPPLRELESRTVPGLYFLGLDRGRNFQSRFLRGIRKDAIFLAARLERKLSVRATHE